MRIALVRDRLLFLSQRNVERAQRVIEPPVDGRAALVGRLSRTGRQR
jgi:hypothetical protein